MTEDRIRTRSHLDLRDWFLEVTREIDETPARTRLLARRRRELASQLIQAVGLEAAAELVDTRPTVLSFLAALSREETEQLP